MLNRYYVFSGLTSNNIQGNLNKPWLMSAFVEIIHKIRPEVRFLLKENFH